MEGGGGGKVEGKIGVCAEEGCGGGVACGGGEAQTVVRQTVLLFCGRSRSSHLTLRPPPNAVAVGKCRAVAVFWCIVFRKVTFLGGSGRKIL